MDSFFRDTFATLPLSYPTGDIDRGDALLGILQTALLDKAYNAIVPDTTVGKPVIDPGLNRAILTVGVPNVLKVTAKGETSGTFYADGVSIGAAYSTGSGNWNIAWTPATIASSVSLTFVGAVTGTSAAVIVTVSRANSYPVAMESWTGGAQCTLNNTIVHPNGAGPVYRGKPFAAGSAGQYIAKACSPVNLIANSGFEIWIGVPATSIFRCVQFNFAAGGGYFNYDTEETTVGDHYTAVVERRTVNGIVWKRVQVQRTDSNAGGIQNTMFIYMTRDFTGTTTNVTAGELPTAVMYFCEPKMIGDIKLPFTAAMQLSWHKDAGATTTLAVTNGEEWKYKHPYHDSETNMSGGAYPGGLVLRTIKPTGWTSTGNYPCLVFLPAVSDSGETLAGNKTAWEAAKDASANYANTYNCVVVVPYDRGETYWWGERAAGPPRKGSKWLANVLMPWLIQYMGVSPNRNDHLLLSYSKGGCVVLSQMLLYPTVWGVGGSKDGAFLNDYPNNNSGSDFDSSGIYALFDPKQILSANVASLNDKKRLTINSGIVWGADNTSFKAQLDAAGILYDTQAVTESVHAWAPTGINGGGTPVLVANMFAQRAAILNPGYNRSSMFLM